MNDRSIGPVLIGGCPRSGTTALMLLLNADPRVFVSDEQDLVRLVGRLDPLLATRERREEKTGGWMRDRSARETASLDDFRRHAFSRTVLPGVILDIYRRLYRQVRPDGELALFGDKFPRYFEKLEAVFALPLPVRYIHVTRNPLDVVSSMLRRTEMSRQGRDWWRGPATIGDMTAVWDAAFRAIRQTGDNPDILHIQYEDLIFETEATMERLGAFLGLALAPEVAGALVRNNHFDRAYLSSDILDALLGHAMMEDYRAFLEASGAGAMSLRRLP